MKIKNKKSKIITVCRECFKTFNEKKEFCNKCYSANLVSNNEIENLVGLKNEIFEDNFKKKFDEFRNKRCEIISDQANANLEKRVILQTIDFLWRSHLQYLEQLRQVIGLRSYGQKDPLSEFKKEAFELFENLLEKIKNDVVKFLLNLNVVITNEEQKKSIKTENFSEKKVGRNDKCPCGSGKKYKHCCGSI